MRQSFILLLFIGAFVACSKEDMTSSSGPNGPQLPTLPYNYSQPDIPQHVQNDVVLSVFENTPGSNPTTDAGATLGRVLFYDTQLSRDNSISCGSCHKQDRAFADNIDQSVGIDGNVLTRNSMTLFNQRYFGRFFWDSRVNSLEQQVLMPIEDHREMDSDLDALSLKLAEIEYYPGLFNAAFGSDSIDAQGISRALAQFIRSINSFDAKYDAGVQNEFVDFTNLELAGKDLFFSGDIKCNHCHSSQNFMNRSEAMMNGLESLVVDSGLYVATGNPDNIGEFKVVSLRNIEVSAPYMHDGRFATLDEVLDHYSSGVEAHPNLNDRITEEITTGGTPFQANLDSYQREALKAFLLTLTDQTLLTDERWSDPFQ